MPKLHVAFADSYEPSGPSARRGSANRSRCRARGDRQCDRRRSRCTHHEPADYGRESASALHPEIYAAEKPVAPAEPKGSAWTPLAAGKPSGARPAPAEMLFPQSVKEAVAQLALGDAMIVSGGTAHALRRERSGFPFAKRLVAVPRIAELKELSIDAKGVLHMGAAVHQEALYDDAPLRKHWQAIEDALEAVGHSRIRRMIIGGSVGPLIGGFDLPVALLALGARAKQPDPPGGASPLWKSIPGKTRQE